MDPAAAASPYVLDDDGSSMHDDADAYATEDASSRASSAAVSRPVTRGSNATRPHSSGSIFMDDGASEQGIGWEDGGSSEVSVAVKRLLCAAKERSASSSSHNMAAIVELYERTKISTAEAQRNPSCNGTTTMSSFCCHVLIRCVAVKVIPMYSEDLLCLPSTAKPRLNALQELFVYYAARQDISVTGKTSQPSFEDILKASVSVPAVSQNRAVSICDNCCRRMKA